MLAWSSIEVLVITIREAQWKCDPELWHGWIRVGFREKNLSPDDYEQMRSFPHSPPRARHETTGEGHRDGVYACMYLSQDCVSYCFNYYLS